MNDMLLLKLGEVVLKGLNRRSFEDRLKANTARRLKNLGQFKIYSTQATIYVEPLDDAADMDAAFDACLKIFGVSAVSRAMACEKNEDAISAAAIEYLRDRLTSVSSFKVESKRSDKSFHLGSIQLSQYVGGMISDAYPHLRVDVHTPELTVNVEVRDYAAYVHAGGTPGAGGLPVGSGGRAVSLLSGGIDSPVSTYMIAKRGVSIIPVHFFSFPYTSQLAKEKVLKLANILTDWCGRLTVELVPFTRIQEQIRDNCPEEYLTIITRRFMMRIAQVIADRNGCGAIVTGANLGQVASQTMEAIGVIEECTRLPVLNPCIGMDKEDIITLARKIGTFDTSILPYEDCCTVFTPRHPRTKPRLDAVLEAEAALDIDTLVKEAVDGIERIKA
ncbi:MAG: tRNA 4-thiouridine(8) synthase ThiI [Oscillospiraceae bacterium]|nr:tRNA 4-thiouridine(8) synthase ThiI [Oscillospiraceae bacterium]